VLSLRVRSVKNETDQRLIIKEIYDGHILVVKLFPYKEIVLL